MDYTAIYCTGMRQSTAVHPTNKAFESTLTNKNHQQKTHDLVFPHIYTTGSPKWGGGNENRSF